MSPPPGFKFRPSKKELIKDLLMPKNTGNDSQVDQFVATVDLYKCEPWDLPHKSKMPDDKKWYFFCVRVQLQGKGTRFNRKTKTGFWKSTCEELKITDGKTKECIGTRRILVFHEGRSPGKKTDWVLHEYALNEPLPNQRGSYVICRLKKKKKTAGKAKKAKEDVNTPESLEGEPYGIVASDPKIPIAPAAVTQEYGHAELNHGSFSQPHLPYSDEGEPTCNVTHNSEVLLTPTSVFDDHAKDSESFTQPLQGHNEIAASIKLADSEDSLEVLLSQFYVDHNEDKTIEGLLGDASQQASSAMPDCPVSNNMDAEAVDQREKVFHSSQPHLPYLDNGKPGYNVTSNSEVPSTATSVVDDDAKDSESLHSTDGHNEMAASYGSAESEEFDKELLNMFFPHVDRYGEAIDGSFGDASQSASSEMTYFPDGPVRRNMDAEGVDGREKVFRSLAHGD